MPTDDNEALDFRVDRKNLYREEIFTDLKACSIKRLTPVKPDGSLDKSRKTLFVGETTLLHPNGALPIQNVIQAKELQQAVKRFPEAMKTAMERLIEEAKKIKEQEDSRIIVPGR
ncbi:MAG: cytoplasmic protein [Deltaproteobacteria bacterium]|nr:cytoplasmic protein [Deltaproteobacteria bacterium]MBW1962694.1 cytoplasmic protein [Deltaproteobacteria bacterium]MBW1993381.1 cytoplasmic protein [Deltaproteobacteria bacterium]MBW2150999.1 cytoplasmic protein [Deltaproteobacteria bacterium]